MAATADPSGSGGSTEPDTMEAVLNLSPEEARTYSMILDAASTLPKSDPRFALTLTFTWWLLHRRRRLEQQRVRRRQFYRRLRRLIFLRWHLQRNTLSSAAMTSSQQAKAATEDLIVPEKRLWVRKDRNEDFWTKVDQNLISPEAFRKYFHMSRETFDYVYDELADQLQKSNTTMRDSLPGKKRLAATIYRMATNAEYIKVASLFGIGKSTTTSLVRDVCEVIVANLKDEFLTFIGEGRGPDDMKKNVEEAAKQFGIPRVIGILGSVDVMCIGSSWDWSENSPYISSYHKNYAVTFQAVVDSEGRFSHVYAGSPSSLSNKQIMEASNLKDEFLRKFSSKKVVVQEGESSSTTQDEPLPARIVADESYGSNCPSSPSDETEEGDSKKDKSEPHPEWLITPEEVEAEVEDENEQQLLLEKIAQARDLFDDAVFNVKSRWKIFHGKNGKINFSADAFEKIALASCILHNICELKDDKVDPSWGSEIGPEVYNRQGYPKESAGVEVDEEEGEDEEGLFDDIEAATGDGELGEEHDDDGGDCVDQEQEEILEDEDMEMEIAEMADTEEINTEDIMTEEILAATGGASSSAATTVEDDDGENEEVEGSMELDEENAEADVET